MCIPKCHWKIIVVNLVEQRCFFVTLPGGLVLCVPGQYRVFPPLAAIIAASRRGILATRRWRRCTGTCAHLSNRAWRSSSRFWGGLSIALIARSNSSQRCSMGLQSFRKWKHLLGADRICCWESGTPSTMIRDGAVSLNSFDKIMVSTAHKIDHIVKKRCCFHPISKAHQKMMIFIFIKKCTTDLDFPE